MVKSKSKIFSSAPRILIITSILLVTSCAKSDDPCRSLKELLSIDPSLAAKKSTDAGDQRLLATGGYAPHVPGIDDGYRPLKVIPGTGDDQRVECRQMQVNIIDYAGEYNKKIVAWRKIR